MKNSFLKTIVTILLLLLCFKQTFAQDDGGSTIYVYSDKQNTPTPNNFYKCYVEIDDSNVVVLNNDSYIKIKNVSQNTDIKVHCLPKSTSFEDAKKDPRLLTVFMFNNSFQLYAINGVDYYLRVFYSNWGDGIQIESKNKSDFDKKSKKLTFQGEYVLENNAQPVVAQQPVQQSIAPQTIQQVTVAESNDFKSDVDVNIPVTGKKASDTFVLIIANEDYQFIDKVKYAARDGEIFKEYCINTLGVPEKQVRYCPNASFGVINGGVDWLRYALENFEGSRGIVYYCGHGIPDEHTGDAYIIPVDGKGTNMMTCYSLNTLYKTLAATNADNITYFMDACFTGANKEGSMLVAARGVAREPKKETLEGKSVVFSASSGDETAMTNEEQHHGLFTYYLLKKIQDTKGEVNYEELAAYINKNVKKDAFLLNEKPQNPVVATSPDAQNTWKQMKLK